jgi:hypothetical protein
MSNTLAITIAVGVGLVAVAAAALLTRGSALVDTELRFRSPLEETALRGEHLNDLLAAMSDQGYAASAVTADGARFDRRHRPAWTIYVAVLLWPLGLLALLRVKRVGLQVRSEPAEDGGTLVVVAGTLTQALRERLRYVLGAPEDRDR